MSTKQEWMTSLHGGHSGSYCDHAVGTLEEVLESAVAKGFSIYGISEHAPRMGEQYLYDNERSLGWDLNKIIEDFERYAEDSRKAVKHFSGRLDVLRGFEIEVVPDDRYVEIMTGFRTRHGFEYMIGSVHFLADFSIDGPREQFEQAMAHYGGLEPLAIAYYQSVAEMVPQLQPEVVGHLDLIRKNGHFYGDVDTPAIAKAARATLAVVKMHNCILDLNTAGWRKGLPTPYPAPWLVREAHAMGIPFCFGDDSHGPKDVGAGIPEARQYLLDHGVDTITGLVRTPDGVARKTIAL